MELTTRPITADEIETFWTTLTMGFGSDPHEEDRDRFFRVIDLDRTIATFDGPDIVGTAGAWSLQLTVPGGAVPMGGTTIVSVLPSHRRRGALRAMMSHHLDDVAAAGEAVAGLWASEASIYGRFGFGSAADRSEIELEGERIVLRADPPPGRVRLVPEDEARKALPPIYDQVLGSRPGMLHRSEPWWDAKFEDPEHWRRGKSKRRYAVYEDNGTAQGYVTYRQKEKWKEFPDGKVDIDELVAVSDDAHSGLWHYLTNIDLYPRVEYWNSPVDDPLPWKVTESRRVGRKISDALWIRLIDIPTALAGRAYENEGRLRIRVMDPFRPPNSGVFEVVASGDRGTCRTVDSDPDVELEVDVLGALYLGGRRARTLAQAGRISGSPEAIDRLDRMFRWEPAPWCPEVF